MSEVAPAEVAEVAPAAAEPQAAPAEAAPAASVIASSSSESASFTDSVSDKFHVFDGEGDARALNVEASAMKLNESYKQLEQRFGNGDAPPESEDGYKLDSEGFAEGFDAEAFMADEGTKGFLKSMHAKGMNNAQVQAVLEYGLNEWAPNLVQGNQELNSESCINSLKETWATDAEYQANMGNANRAYRSLPDSMQEEINARIGNDPLFNRVMSMFGAEMSEDKSVSTTQAAGVASQAEIETLMLSEAYKNDKHPEHQLVSQKVKSFFNRQTRGN